MELIRLDLSDYRNGSKEQKDRFVNQLMKGFSTRGFIKLDNHGFDAAAVNDMFKWNSRFFELDEKERAKCALVPGPYPQRGYSAIGGENFARYHSPWTGVKPPREKRDHKELFDIGPECDNDFPNLWPEETVLPGFRLYMEQTYRGFEQISTDILQALEQGLQVPAGSLTAKCAKGSSEFRFIHYPPLLVKEAQEGMISRAWPHYDIGVISLLFQDSVGGLEIDDGSGGFAPVVSDKPTDLIVNAAETIQRWSNDRLKAGLHRVTIPRTVDADQGDYTLPRRYSIVYFCKANREASVAPLPELIDERHEAKYDDLTFLAYHQQRLQAAYS